MSTLNEILQAVKDGKLSVREAAAKLSGKTIDDLGFAKVDLNRALRQGAAEVIYGESKTPEQISEIANSLQNAGERSVLITRVSKEKFEKLRVNGRIEYFPEAKIAIAGEKNSPDGVGKIVIATGGTSDIPVAEEAAVTAEFFGNEVVRLYDVGVSGLHRLLSRVDEIRDASVVIAIAGMEGALACVIGGIASCPVIAVPTSVGYGASFEGLSALLSMLNACSAGIGVVNIDNGFGAAFLASRINHVGK